jgi:hypothetical protein
VQIEILRLGAALSTAPQLPNRRVFVGNLGQAEPRPAWRGHRLEKIAFEIVVGEKIYRWICSLVGHGVYLNASLLRLTNAWLAPQTR